MDVEDLRTAGEIARKIKEEVKKLVYPGANILDIAETLERMMEEEGGKPSFPVNISINEVAAHYTPKIDEKREVREGDLVKVDFGVLYKHGVALYYMCL